MLPNFMIVGAPKAGTTSLSRYFSDHPRVFFSEPKEVNFFTSEALDRQGLYYDPYICRSQAEYEAIFLGSESYPARGEASVSYLFYPGTAAKIRAAIPDVKIFIVLRDPVHRAYSHYLMDYNLGLVSDSFESIVNRQSGELEQDLLYQQYVELGYYNRQVQAYLESFDREQVKIYLSSDLARDTKAVYMDALEFIGVDPGLEIPDFSRHNSYSAAKTPFLRKLYTSSRLRATIKRYLPKSILLRLKSVLFDTAKPEMSPETESQLRGLYREDILSLQVTLDRDLTDWLLPTKGDGQT